jgi:hypothetical protein
MNCGRPFTIDRPLEAPHKKFCNKKCREEYHYREAKAKREAKQTPKAKEAWIKRRYK